MPGPYVKPVHGDADLPSEVDVVVVGGGIIGASTALELVERGLRVALCEKGGIGHEQSSRNWGWVRISRRDPREVPLMVEALRAWPDLNARVGRETGYKRAGIIFTCVTDQQYADHETWNKLLEPYQLDSHMVSEAEFNNLVPSNTIKLKGALHTAVDGRAEPQLAAPAIAEGARDKGAHLLTECAVRGIETSGGRVSAVVTERGTIKCSAVVLAGGAWSNLFAGNMGIDFPQLKVMNSVLRTSAVEGGPEQAIWHKDFAIRKRRDGGYTIASGHENIVNIVPDSFKYAFKFLPALSKEWRSLNMRFGMRFMDELRIAKKWKLDEPSPFEYSRVLDPVPNRRLTETAHQAAIKAFPALAQAKVEQRWAGYMDVTPDAVPVISPIDRVPGFFLASGFSGHGFGIGPGAGKLMADLVTNVTPCVDPTNFRFSRFSDGSKIELISGF